MPVKDFMHAARYDSNDLQKAYKNKAKSFKEQDFSSDSLIIKMFKMKAFSKHFNFDTGILIFPFIDANHISLFGRLQDQRLSSFFPGWSHSSLSPMLLANAGYYYTGLSDIITCNRCGTKRQPSKENIEEFKRNLKCGACATIFGDSQRFIMSTSIYDRFDSFYKGPTPFNLNHLILPITLAKAGYYYTGFNATIACSYCGTKRQLENEGIENFKENMSCGNCSKDDFENHRVCPNTNHHQPTNNKNDDNMCPDPVNPQYSLYRDRLDTFVDWPHSGDLNPAEMARAGFFYAGYSDCVRCFYCGLGLKSWKQGDNICREHAKHKSTCKFHLSLHQRNLCSSLQEERTAEEPSSVTVTIQNLLQRENQVLRRQINCKVCTMSPIQDLFLPCGHLITCQDCTNIFTDCPTCRKTILATVKVIFT
ncbi:hypothetical protein Btru_033911 [Bulinus truncatus]|nr:hypothetical protein Btru_033911 [Bulinus truncatus]